MSMTYAERSKTYKITTIQFHREEDADIIAWLEDKPNQTDALRRVVTDHLRNQGQPHAPAGADPDAIRQVVESCLSQHLGNLRLIVQSSIDTALKDLSVTGVSTQAQSDEVNDLLTNLNLALDIDD